MGGCDGGRGGCEGVVGGGGGGCDAVTCCGVT